MVRSNTNALGIIFPNIYDKLVPELTSERLMASIPFGGRYRMIDFLLSSMVNCGIDNISILVRENYFSLTDHLGSGREWDLVRKNGGLNIFPPFAQKSMNVYGGRIEAIAGILGFLRSQKEKYVVMADTNIAMNFDFNAMIDAHVASGADITVAYKKEELPADLATMRDDSSKGTYYTFDMDDEDRINGIHINSQKSGVQNYGMNVYVMERELLIDTINTKIRDDNPTRYIGDAKASNVMIADGCVIEGEVENSILFRGVKIGKGAKVKNCILMQDTVVEDGADLEYVITDKKVHVSEGKNLSGTDTFPVFVAKRQTV